MNLWDHLEVWYHGGYTWRCESCGEKRPDSKISVYTFDIPAFPGAKRNWKYCNDRLLCRSTAVIESTKGPYVNIIRVQSHDNNS